MENVGTFYGHLEYITAIWYILWPFGILVVNWNNFPCFGILHYEKSGNPGTRVKYIQTRSSGDILMYIIYVNKSPLHEDGIISEKFPSCQVAKLLGRFKDTENIFLLKETT
jgi:hypothetical protein